MAQVVGDYYAAMNAHVVDRALSFLHPNVLVTFPEQERNWRGVEAAREKFGGMFERMPGFTGSFEVVNGLTDRAVYVYWQQIHPSERNGPDFGYTVTEVLEAGRPE